MVGLQIVNQSAPVLFHGLETPILRSIVQRRDPVVGFICNRCARTTLRFLGLVVVHGEAEPGTTHDSVSMASCDAGLDYRVGALDDQGIAAGDFEEGLHLCKA